MIVGIDEVGRGCWAGPVVAGAVLLKRGIPGLRDSKQLTKLQRERLDGQIRAQAIAYGVGWADAAEIDTWGMTHAVRLAMQRALAAITHEHEAVIIDGKLNFLKENPKARTLVKADGFIQAVSAASIIAKVARDKFMVEAAQQFSGYGFERHVGYGTRQHLAALRALGICELHRRSFRPIQALLT